MLRTLVATMGGTRLLELSFTDNGAATPTATPTAAGPSGGPSGGLGGGLGGGVGGLAAGVVAQVAAVVSPAQAASGTTAATTAGTTAAANTASDTTANAGAGATRRIYRLPVTLKVSGNWAELNALLEQIETRAPALHWQVLGLENSEWPAIQLTLYAHVRSLQPRWGTGP